jgi:hypothetical protein
LKPRSPHNVFVLALCILALFVSQTLGSRAGFVCDCSGKPVPTKATHCYGPHGTDCHADEGLEAGACSGEENSGDRENHIAVNEEVQMRPVEVAPQSIAPQVLLSLLPMMDYQFSIRETTAPARYFVESGESPPMGVSVARTIVLLI